jgi:hypothetical protein
MTLSMYQASVPVFTRQLRNLSTLLDKGLAHAHATGLDPAELVAARLAPDMLPLSSQIQIASDNAKGCAARLAGVEPPRWEDKEQTIPELQARIARTLDFLQGFEPGQIDGSEDREITLKLRDREVKFSGQEYLLCFALPNFFFHMVTAYDLLRHKGVPLGKRDYLGS